MFFFCSYTSHFLAMVNTFQSGLDRPFIFFCVREWIFCHNFCVGSWKKWCQVWHHLTTLMWRVWCTFTRYYKYIKRSTLDFFPFEFFCNFFLPLIRCFLHTQFILTTRVLSQIHKYKYYKYNYYFLQSNFWREKIDLRCAFFPTTSCCFNGFKPRNPGFEYYPLLYIRH